jgi:hypothetical protein
MMLENDSIENGSLPVSTTCVPFGLMGVVAAVVLWAVLRVVFGFDVVSAIRGLLL